MALSPIFYARGDSSSANNAELNVLNTGTVPVTAIQFTTFGTSGDLTLDYVADGNSDANTLPEFDPDTKVIIDGVEYSFAFVKSGTLQPSRVPASLADATAYIIKVDFNGDGDLDDADDRNLFFTLDPDATFANMAAIQNGALRLGSPDLDPPPEPVCFCSGTWIETPLGNRAVEDLEAGDMVMTEEGVARRVLWVGRTRLTREALRHNPRLRPVVIPAGALGAGMPAADLSVSPCHRVMIRHPACDLLFGAPTVLVAAKFLVGHGVAMARPEADVTYMHVLTQDHEMLIGNGMPSESFQPARRTLDVMDAPSRFALVSTLRRLGEAEMFTRRDRYPSLNRRQAQVLLDWMSGPFAPVGVGPEARLATA
jgi:hypothetical protein